MGQLATHTSMTYGTCPDENEFYVAWARGNGHSRKFQVKSGACSSDPLEGDWHPEEMWAEIADACTALSEGRLDLEDPKLDSCSAVLSYFGFEWI